MELRTENSANNTVFSSSRRPVKSVSNYPELYDKHHNGKEPAPFILTKCTRSFLKGSCASGHQLARALVCGKEWCQECGENGSIIHQRRMARWWGKAMQMPKMGYLVITVPKPLREDFKSKKILSEFRTYAKRKLQRMGYKRGLIRYHWAGDCAACKGKGCEKCYYTGADREYKPHLNVLIDQGYLKPEEFQKKFVTFRNDLKVWFNKKFKQLAQPVEGNIYFTYATDSSHKVHKLKYITRATWRFWNPEICNIIKGYRTTSTWGKWDKPDVERASPLVAIEAGICPCCKTRIKWVKEFISVREFSLAKSMHLVKQLGGGYFLINSS